MYTNRFENWNTHYARLTDFLPGLAQCLRRGICAAHRAHGVRPEDFARDLTLPLEQGNLKRSRLVSRRIREAADPYAALDAADLLRYLLYGGCRVCSEVGTHKAYARDQDLFFAFFDISVYYRITAYEPWRRVLTGHNYPAALAELLRTCRDLRLFAPGQQEQPAVEKIPGYYARMIGILEPLCAAEWEYRDSCKALLAELQQAHLEAKLDLGRCLQYGSDCDWDKAVEIYRELAEQNYAPGIHALGLCYIHGHGVRADKAKANELFLHAAGLGCCEAMLELADSYQFGRGVPENPCMALGLCTAAAAAGSGEGMFRLGKCYRDGVGTPIDLEQAVCWFTRAAEQEVPQAMFAMGRCCAEGFGVPESLAAAEDWYRSAAEGGMEVAAYVLDALGPCSLMAATDGVRVRTMVDYLWSLADGGDPVGRRLLANCYLRGIGVEKDWDAAVGLMTMAAENGSVPAMRTLGEWYSCGFGVEKDPVQARQWYERAASQGDTTAMRLLAELYLEGIDGEPDPDKALTLYEAAAKAGDAEAAYLLAEYYLAGTLPCDPKTVRERAVDLLTQAAQLGNGDAAIRLIQLS